MGRRVGRLSAIAGVTFVAFALLGTSVVAGAASSASGPGPIAQKASLKKCLKKAKKIQNPVKRQKAKKKCHLKFGSGTGPGTGTNPLANCTTTNKCATSVTMTGCPAPGTSRALPVSVSGVLSPDAGGSPITVSYDTYTDNGAGGYTTHHQYTTVVTDVNGAWSFSYTPGSPGTGTVGESLAAQFGGDATRSSSLTVFCNWSSV